MMGYIKPILSFLSNYSRSLVSILCFLVGITITYLYYENKISDIRHEFDLEMVKQISENNEKLQQRERENARIIEEKDKLQSKYNTAIRNIDSLNYRVQHFGENTTNDVHTTDRNSSDAISKEFSRSRELLKGCSKLLTRGVELSGETSIKLDTLIDIYTKNNK